MRAKEFLIQSLRIRESLRYIGERIEKLKNDLECRPMQLDDSGASRTNCRQDKLAEKMAEIADLQTEWEQKRLDLEKKNDEIRGKVEEIKNPEYIAVLTARYLTENKRNPCRLNSWVAVAFKLGMTSEEAVKQKHKRAMRELEKILISDTL